MSNLYTKNIKLIDKDIRFVVQEVAGGGGRGVGGRNWRKVVKGTNFQL